jgi:hypothetical protein
MDISILYQGFNPISASGLLTIYLANGWVFRPFPASPSETLTPSLDVRRTVDGCGDSEGSIVFTSLAAYLAPDATRLPQTLPFSNEYSVTACR